MFTAVTLVTSDWRALTSRQDGESRMIGMHIDHEFEE